MCFFRNFELTSSLDILRKYAENDASENLRFHKISQIDPKYRYVDEIPILIRVQIS